MLKKYLKQSIEFTKRSRLRKIGNYHSMDEFIYKNGIFCKFKPLPKDIRRGPMRQCYKNATMLAVDRSEYFYVEGIARGVIPTMHAWCIDKDRNVIDPTWDDGKEYYGVVFKEIYLLDHIAKYERCGLIDDYQNEWPVLRLNKKIWKEELN